MIEHTSPPGSPSSAGGLTISKRHLTFSLGNFDSTDVVTLTNPHDLPYAFKVKTTNPQRYVVRPNLGAVAPGASVDVAIALHRQPAAVVAAVDADSDLVPGIARDKFLFQSAPAPGLTPAHTPANFWASQIQPPDTVAVKLRVNFVDGHSNHSPLPLQHAAAASLYESSQTDNTPITPTSAYKSPHGTRTGMDHSSSNIHDLTSSSDITSSTVSTAPSKPLLVPKSKVLPDAEELLRPGNGVAARLRAEKLQNDVDTKAASLAALKADLRETKAETERVLSDAPKAPLAANQVATDPFGGVSIAAIALFILLFAVVAKAIF